PELASIVPSALALRFRAVPVSLEGNRLQVAIANPRDTAALNEIGAATGLNIIPLVSPEFRIIQTIERLYRVRPTGKRGIVIKSAPPSAGRQTAEPPRGETRDYGLDGQPLFMVSGTLPEADTTPDGVEDFPTQDTHPSHSPLPAESRAVPKSIREWREEDPFVPEDLALEIEPIPESRTSAVVAPSTFDEVIESLRGAASRDDVCRQVAGFMARHFKCAAILALMPDHVRVLDAAGEVATNEGLRRLSIPAGLPNLFESLREGKTFHLGPVLPLPGNRVFFSVLGGDAPPSALVIPVTVRERAVALLYADNRTAELGPVDLALWRRLSQVMGVALEIQLLRKKLGSA
ncbi:MAG: hypothetical protein ACRD1B_03345, partial [Thermoanaerobaculia bacterium]